MVRPSNLGYCSTTAISAISSAIFSSKFLPSSESDISRPLNITVTFTYLFNLECALFLFCFLFLFGLLIFIAAVIHYFAYRRVGIRRNFHKIKTEITGCRKSLIGWYNTNLIAVRINNSDLSRSYIFINICFVELVWPICFLRYNYTFYLLQQRFFIDLFEVNTKFNL